MSDAKFQLLYVEGLKHINYQMQKIMHIEDRETGSRFLKDFIRIRKRIEDKQKATINPQIIVKRMIVNSLFILYKRQIKKHLSSL